MMQLMNSLNNENNGVSSLSSSNPKTPAMAILCFLVVYSLLEINLEPYSPSSHAASRITLEESDQKKYASLGREIVERSFQETYKVLLEECSNTTIGLTKCMRGIHKKGYEQPQNTTTTRVFPWWFETLLRDASDRGMGLQGPWHHNVFLSPPTADDSARTVEFCNIEKTASSEWKILDCLLKNKTGASCQGGWETPGKNPKAVFLRDPLERFLSGFVDKCINVPKREKEHHCEPNDIFAPGGTQESKIRLKTHQTPYLVQALETNNRIFFDAYTDVIGLRWNVHFAPASLYCDGLFRTLPQYDFVGHMGGEANFHDNLRSFGQRYNILAAVERVFNLQSPQQQRHLLETTTATLTEEDKMMKKRLKLNRKGSASKKVKEYYTARSLRRALEYLSIDYAREGLNLPIPSWVDEMLEEEVQLGLSPRAVS